MRLVIGIPTFGTPDPLFSINSLPPLLYHIGRRHPEITDAILLPDSRTYRHHARQAIVNAAQSVHADYLLMLDDDQTFTPQAFDILWAHRDHPVVSGLYFTRTIPPVPCVFNMTVSEGSVPVLDYPEDQLFEVQIVGFGFILFDMNIFKKIPPPYFQVGNWLGEDVAFGAKCQAAGIPLLVHTGCKVGHIVASRRVVTEALYLKHKERVKRDDAAKVGAIPWAGQPRARKGNAALAGLTRSAVAQRIGEAFAPLGAGGKAGGPATG